MRTNFVLVWFGLLALSCPVASLAADSVSCEARNENISYGMGSGILVMDVYELKKTAPTSYSLALSVVKTDYSGRHLETLGKRIVAKDLVCVFNNQMKELFSCSSRSSSQIRSTATLRFERMTALEAEMTAERTREAFTLTMNDPLLIGVKSVSFEKMDCRVTR